MKIITTFSLAFALSIGGLSAQSMGGGCTALSNTLKSAVPLFEATEGSDSWKESKSSVEKAAPILAQALVESQNCPCIELQLPKVIEKLQKEAEKGFKSSDWDDTKKSAESVRKDIEDTVKDIEKCQDELEKLQKK